MCRSDRKDRVVPADESKCVLDAYLSYRHRSVDLAASIVGCRAQAEDLVHDAFVKIALTHRPELEIRHPLAYFLQVVRRLAIDTMRQRNIRKTSDIADQGLEILLADPLTPELHTSGREELDAVEQALAALPARTRRAFEMKRFEGLKLREIAIALDISVVRASQLINDALLACQNVLDSADPRT
nr:sigma-70 family RNA polymerase sigma factor [Gluconobacter sp. Dm-44]